MKTPPIRKFTSSTSSNPPSYPNLSSKYNVAVAFQPKDREEGKLAKEHFKTKPLDSPTGEDNYFVANRQDSSIAVGVADGVGGWSELGFDSSAISRELCKSIAGLYNEGESDRATLNPNYLLDEAFTKVQKEGIVKVGGTTMCLGVFSPSGEVKISNLGDSWAGIFRDHKLIYQTKIQTHAFNTPYQLAIIPDSILNRQEGSRFIMDKPSQADDYFCKLQKNDLVLFATDGVIDNVDVQDIELFLEDHQADKLEVQAQSFVKEVVKLSKDENFPSVFSQELSKLTGQNYSGGKEDDITVVFVKVN